MTIKAIEIIRKEIGTTDQEALIKKIEVTTMLDTVSVIGTCS